MSKGVILVADDDAAVRMVVNKALLRVGYDVRVTSNVSTLWQWIEAGEGDCVICDVIMPDGEAFDVLPQISQNRPELPVILISAQNTFMTAIRAQEAGAFDYLPKPFDLNALVDTVERGLFEPKVNAATPTPKDPQNEMPLVGRSAAMQEIFRTIARLRQSTLPVLLTGESGVGKSHIARVIHDFSDREAGPLASLDLTGMREAEMELALFGAGGEKKGMLERSGTVYINEILDLSPALQARLLQHMRRTDEKAKSTYSAQARIITATSGEPRTEIADRRFREDLFYRLATVPIHVPALHERREDISDLVHHFLGRMDLTDSFRRHLEPDGIALLREADWPGNVLELENFIRRICLLIPHETITAKMVRDHLPVTGISQHEHDELPNATFANLREATTHFTRHHLQNWPTQTKSGESLEESNALVGEKQTGNGDESGGLYHALLAEFEQPVITEALNKCNGNQIKAARLLGLNRNTLRKKIREHDIKIMKIVR